MKSLPRTQPRVEKPTPIKRVDVSGVSAKTYCIATDGTVKFLRK